jgi:hypothetical protein
MKSKTCKKIQTYDQLPLERHIYYGFAEFFPDPSASEVFHSMNVVWKDFVKGGC